MQFLPTNTFEQNLDVLRKHLEGVDPECTKILFDNLTLLVRGGDTTPDRQAVEDFHAAVATALAALPEITP